MKTFTTSVDIDAPPDRVWQVMSDVEKWFEWTPSITRIERLDDGPFAVGSRVAIHQPKFPRASWKVTALEPGRSFTWTSDAPGMRVVGHHSVEPIENGSRATLRLDYHGPVGSLFARLTQGITERYITFEAKGLKARSENPEFHHSETRI